MKWIYSSILKGNSYKTFEKISKWSLGQVINKLEILDYSDNKPFLSKQDYRLLETITTERNYLVHQVYRDFLYIDNWYSSTAYRKACDRLMNFHNQMDKLYKTIEKVRLKPVKQYAR